MNIIMAVIITGIILIISVIKNPKAKSMVYGLPIPITIVLIASESRVNETHIIGLMLLVLFLWVVAFLHSRGWQIVVADICTAILYIIVGILLMKLVKVSFEYSVIFYIFAWFTFIFFIRKRKYPNQDTSTTKKINLWIKGVLIFTFAFCLLEVKDLLSGIIVTFPFSGVFAVVEMKKNLNPLALEFTKNSLAILAFFVTVYYTVALVGIIAAVLIGWVVYFTVFHLIKKVD